MGKGGTLIAEMHRQGLLDKTKMVAEAEGQRRHEMQRRHEGQKWHEGQKRGSQLKWGWQL